MKSILSSLGILGICVSLLFCLTGCEDTTAQRSVIDNAAYATFEAIGSAEQPESVAAGRPIYTSVDFIESPLGMRYDIEWLYGGAAVYAEQRAMETDARGILVFELPAERAVAGELTVRVSYKGRVALEKTVTVK